MRAWRGYTGAAGCASYRERKLLQPQAVRRMFRSRHHVRAQYTPAMPWAPITPASVVVSAAQFAYRTEERAGAVRTSTPSDPAGPQSSKFDVC